MTLPQGWVQTTLLEAGCEVQSGFPSGRHNDNGEGVAHLRPMNVSRTGAIDLSELRFVPDEKPLRMKRGDVLFNNTNSPALIGKTAYFDLSEEYAFSNHMTRVRPPDTISGKFLATQLHYMWMTGVFQALCRNHVNQASVAGSVLARDVLVALPPLAEQHRIVEEVDRQFSILDAMEATIDTGLARADRLRQSILREAFAGRLVPQNPADEPASALLDRIAAGRTDS